MLRAPHRDDPGPDHFDDPEGLQELGETFDLGLFAAFDLAPEGAPGQRGFRAVQDFFEAGVLVRVTGDAVLVAPAFVAEAGDLEQISERLRAVLRRY